MLIGQKGHSTTSPDVHSADAGLLATPEETGTWMTAPHREALRLQRPLPDDALVIVERDEKRDEVSFAK